MEVREGYKKTEMGVIPGDWEVINLAEKSTLKARIGWQGLTTKEYLSFGNYYLVTGTDLIDNQIDWRNCCYVDKSRYEQDKNIQIKDGDLLVTKDGTIGKIAYIENMKKPATLNSGVFVIRPVGGSYLPKYLFYVLSSTYFVNFLKQLTAGSTIIHLYQKDFVKFNFLLPPLPEQQAIAEALSDVDAVVSSLTKLINKKKNIKQGAMKELLTGKKRLEGFTGEWGKVRLGDVGKFISGSGFPLKYQSSKIDKYPFYKVSDFNNVGNGIYMKNANNYINEDVRITLSAKVIPKNAIIFAKIGAAIFLERKRIALYECCIDNNMMCFVSDSSILNEKFAYYIFQNNNLSDFNNATALPSLNAKAIGELAILVPPTVIEQTAIANILSDMDAEIEALEQKLSKYKAIKQGMMHELLNGRIRLI
jgi:type I restriction enzyme S subunit